MDGGFSLRCPGSCLKRGSYIIRRVCLYICDLNHFRRRGQSVVNSHLPQTCMSREDVTDFRYFKKLVLDYLRSSGTNLLIKCFSSNPLDPEIIKINSSAKHTITVLSDNYFTRLACSYPPVDTCTPDSSIPSISGIDGYISHMNWQHRLYLKYMKTKARLELWSQTELFKRIATFHAEEKN